MNFHQWTFNRHGLSTMPDGLVTCWGTVLFHWTIDLSPTEILNFRWIVLQSSEFGFEGSTYFLQLKRHIDMTEVYISGGNALPPQRKLRVKLGVWSRERREIEWCSGETDDRGFLKVVFSMPMTEMMEHVPEILPAVRLTIFCELKRFDTDENVLVLEENHPNEKKNSQENEISKSDSDEDTEYKIFKHLQKDLEDLLISREDSDVTLKVQGKEFPAHRGILRARSPVFRSMFSHEMVENLTGEVVVDDCDPGTFPDFLNYVYTGNIKHIGDENVCQLYITSDKYQVEELKEVCKAYMKRNFSVGAFCDILTLALRHTETELIDLSTEFFCVNATEITQTAKWQTFLHENTTVGNELFIKFLSKGHFKV